jgi:hypothetical protein
MERDVNKETKKQRGIFLNIMILLLIIGDLQIPYYLLNPDALTTVYGSIPSWYPIYAVLGLISNIAIIIGMWKMKKMGNLRIGCLFCLQNTSRFSLYLAR